jgi:uncharacterized protein (TIGR04255 family)
MDDHLTANTKDPLRRRIYRDPPVVEAIARFQWSTELPWSITTPGILYERVKAYYPDEPEAQAQMRAGLVEHKPGDGSESDRINAEFQLRAGPERLVYGNRERGHLLAVSPKEISAHGLPPYEGWGSIRDRLIRAVSAVTEVTSGDRPAVAEVGLRYINKVEIPKSAIEFIDYFTISIGFPPGFPETIVGFLDRTQMTYPDGASLTLTWASTDAPEGSSGFIVDIDLLRRFPEPIDIDGALETLRDLKEKEGRAFEGLLQDSLRNMFHEVEQVATSPGGGDD